MKKIIEDINLTDMSNPYLVSLIAILIAYVLFLITNKIILRSISKIFQKTSTEFDDILLEQKVFHKLPYLIPLIFLYSLMDLVPLFQLVERFIIALIALIILLTMNSIINAFNDLYKKRSQINKQIAADIKNGMTKQQLDQKYGDNLKNINRNLNDHLGKVDDFGKGLKPLQQRNIKTYKTVPLQQQPKAGDIIKDKFGTNKVVTQKDLKDMERKQQGQLSSVGTVGGVSGQKDKTPGATFGNPGVGNQVGTGAVSGGKTDATGKAKEQPGDLTGQEIGIKGQSIGTTGVGQGTTTGVGQGQGSIAQVQNPSQAISQNNVVVKTIPVTPPPAPITDPNLKIGKYDPKKDPKGTIIYKGKEAPKNMVKFKPVDVGGLGGLAKRLQGK